ncbi:Hypothetical protein R9X50_00009300 [Acrodontium crateriforme]|uniref:Rad16 n=1 Tax=Acrodontium crateriforme TaxID=150365 RepID=A0AAQ3LY60_9PEZI|nr:Hypothetical protein R9X50_00009300 [Acrodontium crateriforme]
MARSRQMAVGRKSASSLDRNSTNAAITRRRLATRTKSAVLDSENDSDEDSIRLLPPRNALKAVVIPAMAPSENAKKFSLETMTDSALSSVGSTSRGDSADVDTPDTTPAVSVKGISGFKRKRSQRQLGESALKLNDTDKLSPEADEALAIRLQEHEYTREDAKQAKRTKLVENEIQNSEDESELSDPESFFSLDDAPLKSRLRSGSPSAKATSLPRTARTASLKARKSISKNITKLEDSESALSEPETVDSFVAGASGVESFGEVEEEDDSIFTPNAEQPRISEDVSRENVNRIPRESPEAITSLRLTRKHRERKKLEHAHPVLKTMWDDLERTPVIKPIAAEQPASITRKLKTFQLEGLNWMMRQEQTCYKGGLLGDEMGMGKTIQAVSLIMSDYPQQKPTLVLVPPVALMQWSSEIEEYTNGKLKVLIYHGQNTKVKKMSINELKSYDVIMISYNSLESLYRKETKGWSRGDDLIKEDSPIHAIHFHRLILDEAHSIKTRTTGVAKACFALKGKYKWCLSGTPVQNRIGEFFSLLRFLEVRPFADYFCKRCPCALLHWKLNKDHKCEDCDHSGLEHISIFNQELLNPLTEPGGPSDRSRAMDKLQMITSRIMLRRLKKDHTGSMELPPKEVIVHNEFFGDIERDFSSSIMSSSTRQFDTYVARGVVLNNFANIFSLLTSMRLTANHPDLILKRQSAEGQNSVLVCNICDEVAYEAIRSQCKHDFCRVCVKSYLQSTEDNADCPRCHIPLSIDLDQPEIEQVEDAHKKGSIVNRIDMNNWTSSTKIEMLVYDLYKLRSKKQTLKTIVFSQFTTMLQLIEWRLRRAGFSTVMLDGSMSPIQRQKSIEYFMTNPEVEVFLVSLKAGGVALNLTEASRVFIVDPWWNPAAEWQSADRCHRIGQRRPCVIKRLCIEDSVESRMIQLQEKKSNMINSTINNDRTSFEKLTPADMEFLFRGN